MHVEAACMQMSLPALDRMQGSTGVHSSNLTAAEDALVVAAYNNADGQIWAPQRKLDVAQQDILDMAEAVCWSLQTAKVPSSELGGFGIHCLGTDLSWTFIAQPSPKGNLCDEPLPPGSCCMQAGSKLAMYMTGPSPIVTWQPVWLLASFVYFMTLIRAGANQMVPCSISFFHCPCNYHLQYGCSLPCCRGSPCYPGTAVGAPVCSAADQPFARPYHAAG